MIKVIFLILLFGFPYISYSQNIPDSLTQKSYEELIAGYNAASVFAEIELYGKAYIKKAKKDNITSYLVTGYHLMAYIYDDSSVLVYCDSIIALTEDSNDKLYPATAYSIKGSHYYDKGDYKKALDNFLTAGTYAKKHDNKDLLFRSSYAIGILKDRIGESKSALQIHQKNFVYVKQHVAVLKQWDYLNSIFALANTFNELKVLDSATFYNSYGVRESLRLNDQRKYNHFVLNSGTTNYYGSKYIAAIDSIKKALPYFEGVGNKPNVAIGYYYLGKSYFAIDKTEEALFYLKKTDSIFRESNDILPKIRDSYILLITYYEYMNNLEQQLNYMKQLMKLDSIVYDNQFYLNKNIIKEYDIPKAIAENEERIINVYERKDLIKQAVIITISIILVIALLLFYDQYKRRKLYKKRAEALTREKYVKLNYPGKKRQGKKELGISKEVEKRILSSLESFENKKGYLDPEVNLHNLAKKIKTNDNHLSRVVNHHKNASFPNYLNSLRITYAVEALKANAVYRRYTNKALAGEFGFKRAEPFSRAFLKYAQTRPADFIRELENTG